MSPRITLTGLLLGSPNVTISAVSAFSAGTTSAVSCLAGVPPRIMGIGPAFAIPKALNLAGLKLDQIEVIELNEAFAVQALQCMRELGIDEERLNVNGGAIALGHPLGCSGARIIVTLLYELERREGRYGLATMCIGVGQGIATIIERL